MPAFSSWNDVAIPRRNLGVWLQLEKIRELLSKAVGDGDSTKVLEYILSYTSTALDSILQINMEKAYWGDVADLYSLVLQLNQPIISFPMLSGNTFRSNDTGTKKEEGWEYPERTKYLWINSISQAYGWTIEYILDLDIDDALGLLQEILLSDQFKKEWEWSLSELAYSYDKTSKTSKFNKLDRPAWMNPIIPTELPKIKIRTAHLPVGLVLEWSNDEPTEESTGT